jgi:SAM-dependent methyltransferase
MIVDKQAQLKSWWQSPPAELLLNEERAMLANLSSTLSGFFYVQLGADCNLIPRSNRISLQTLISPEGDLSALPEALPFKSHSIDNLFLLHVLEYADDPHQVLRETERVLAADGKVVLCCFNPISLWGLRRLFSWQDRPPWRGQFFSQTRLTDWLALLNFEVVEQHKIIFYPPFKQASWLRRSRFLERWGKRLWPWLGAVSVMVATKRTIPLNPIKQDWRQRRLFPTPGLVNKPITRDNKHGSC